MRDGSVNLPKRLAGSGMRRRCGVLSTSFPELKIHLAGWVAGGTRFWDKDFVPAAVRVALPSYFVCCDGTAGPMESPHNSPSRWRTCFNCLVKSAGRLRRKYPPIWESRRSSRNDCGGFKCESLDSATCRDWRTKPCADGI